MKHIKTLGLVVTTFAALATLAGAASATPALTSPSGTEYTGSFQLTLTSSLLMKQSVFNETCAESTVSGNVTINDTIAAGGPITTLGFTNCGSATIHILQKGFLEVLPSGTVRGSGTQLTTETIGVSCVYGTTNGTTLGTLTGGNPAIVHVKASLPRISGSFLCANPATWEGQYTFTAPKPLLLN